MKSQKNFITLLTLLLFLSGALKIHAVNIYIDNEKINNTVPAEIKNGATFVPLRIISENLGININWEKNKKTVIINNGYANFVLPVGKKYIEVYKDGELLDNIELSYPIYIKKGTTMVPLRAISTVFGLDIKWDNDTKSVRIPSSNNMSSYDETNNEVQQSSKANPQDTKMILNSLKNIPRINTMFFGENYNKNAIVEELDSNNWFGIIARLRERAPGQYKIFSVTDAKHPIDGVYIRIFMEKTSKKMYYNTTTGSAIFSLPNNKIVNPVYTFTFNYPEGIEEKFVNEDDFTQVLRSIAMQKNMIDKDDDLYVIAKTTGEGLNLKLYKKTAGRNILVETFVADIAYREIYVQYTGDTVYSDLKYTNRDEVIVTEKNADKELIRLLKTIGQEPKGKYSITDIKPTSTNIDETDAYDKRVGYTLTIRQDASDPNFTTSEHYFINNTGTVVMQYDVIQDAYFYIIGEFTAFG